MAVEVVSPVSNDLHGSLALPSTRIAALREGERAQVLALLEKGHGLVTITGLGGIGKSTLALDVIDALRVEHPEFTCSVVTVGPAESEEGRERLLDELGRTPDESVPGEAATAGVLEPRLVVIDGGEHLLGSAANLLDIIDSSPGLHLLVTSRVALDLASEVTVELRGLDTGAEGDAVRLFSALAGEYSVGLEPGDRPRVHEIVTRLGGYPLAIRLCVLRLQTQPLSALHEQIIGRKRQLDGSLATDPLLREVIEWSLDRQSEQALRLLKLLTVFNGWSTLDSIEGVAAEADRRAGPSTRRAVGRTLWLAELVEAGLVDVQDAPALGETVRVYRVHDSIRDVAREYRAAGEIPPSMLREAHRSWYGASAADLASDTATRREAGAFARMQTEFSEYSVALDAMIDADPRGALRIVNQTGDFWVTRGRLRVATHLLRRALQKIGEDPDGLGAGSLDAMLAQSWLSHMKVRSGATMSAPAYQRWLSGQLREVLEGAVEASREHFTLATHFLYIALVNKEYRQGLMLGARSWELAVEAGDDHHAGVFSFFQARVSDQAGEPVEAAAHIERAIVHARRTQDESFLARCVSLAVLIEQDSLSPAELVEKLTPLPEILLRNRSFKDAVLISIPLAIAHFRTGQDAEAIALLRRTLALSKRIHFFDGQMYAVVLIAFAELSEHSTPENIARCARLYGNIRPHLKRFYAVTAPYYQQMLEGGIHGLSLMLGKEAFDRITSQPSTPWPATMAEADAFAAELLQGLGGAATDEEQSAEAAERVASALGRLNDRERELLDLVLTGITDKQIAERLELKPNTVRSYNSRIFRKFDVASRTELLALFRSREL